jgi:hypothetical protein
MSKHSERRLKENEIIFRQANQNIQEFVEATIGEKNLKVRFYCECSNVKCRQRISMTVAQYEEEHKNKRQFIVLPGHEMAEIEKITKTTPDFVVVEKFGEMPHKDALDIALTRLAAE